MKRNVPFFHFYLLFDLFTLFGPCRCNPIHIHPSSNYCICLHFSRSDYAWNVAPRTLKMLPFTPWPEFSQFCTVMVQK